VLAPFVVVFTCVFVLLGAGAGVIAGALPFDAVGVRAVAGFILLVLGRRPRTTDRAWTRLPWLVFPQCSLAAWPSRLE
jgi:cytochrome c biogenesis protein CcdA